MRTVAMVAVAALGAMLSGCTSTAADGVPPVVATSPQTERVVEFWYMPNGPDPARDLGEETKRFEADHPGVRIKLVALSWESALTRLITAATSGSGPDVLQIGTTWVPGIAELGALQEFRAQDIDELGGREAFVASSWASTSLLGSEDTVAVPWFLDTRAAFYRTDLFEDLGLDPAAAFADWDTFESTLQAIRDDGRMHALAVSGADDWNVVHDLAPWVWAAGGSFLSADASEPAIALPAAIDGVDVYQRLVATYNHPDALHMGVGEAQKLFVDGEAGIMFAPPSVVNDLRTSYEFNEAAVAGWATIPLPSGPSGRQAFLGGSNLAVSASTSDPEAALAWVRFLTSEPSQLRYAHAIGMLPARTSALADASVRDDPGFRPFVEQLVRGQQYPPSPAWLHVEVTLQNHLGQMWREVAASGALERVEVERRLQAVARDVHEILSGER